MASVIIPAHNEELTIGSTLGGLLPGLDGGVEVIVVCNGCTDATADAARSFDRVAVVEIDVASKIAALNAGDAVATRYPRLYLDADIGLDAASLGKLVDALSTPGALAAEPVPRIDTRGSSRPVRAYYAASLALHGQSPGDVGSGVYAMSRQGRARFGRFPDIIADDAFARAHFGEGELIRVDGAVSVVGAPVTLTDLIRIKTRSRLGTKQLAERYPELWARKRRHSAPLLEKARKVPARTWVALPVYVVVQLTARLRARRAARSLDTYRWQRDDSSRMRPPS